MFFLNDVAAARACVQPQRPVLCAKLVPVHRHVAAARGVDVGHHFRGRARGRGQRTPGADNATLRRTQDLPVCAGQAHGRPAHRHCRRVSRAMRPHRRPFVAWPDPVTSFVTHFCLPGLLALLQHSTANYSKVCCPAWCTWCAVTASICGWAWTC